MSTQNLMVEDNVIKLELKRVRDALYKTSDGVIGLEKKKMNMQTAMKERREEIRIHVEMLRQQIKAADAERHTINAELHERISRIDRIKKRSVGLLARMTAHLHAVLLELMLPLIDNFNADNIVT